MKYLVLVSSFILSAYSQNKIKINLYPSNSKNIAILVHGYASDKDSEDRIDFLKKVFNESNYSLVSYDARGHGESSDIIVSFDTMKEDLKTVFDWCVSKGYTDIVLLGVSMGCYAAAKTIPELDKSKLKAFISLGGVTMPVDYKDEDLGPNDKQREVKNRLGYYIEDRWPQKHREHVKISSAFWHEITNFSPKDLWNFDLKTLFIHGDSGGLEKRFLDATLKNRDLLPKDHELVVIDEASHSFLEHQDEVCLAIENFLKKI